MIRSMVTKRFALALVCAAALSTGLAACGGDDDDDSGGSGSGSATEADGGSAAVTIEGFEFSAQPVAAGSSFEVDNRDSAAHTFTADDGAFDVEVRRGHVRVPLQNPHGHDGRARRRVATQLSRGQATEAR
jgi:hypothetical protein